MPNKSSADVSGNARLASFRMRHARLDVSLPTSIDQTIQALADENHAKKSDVVRMLIRYALTHRDWKSQGFLWRLMDL